MSSDIVYLGIDLGTSRTSIVTSTGFRETVWSYVGYPKDHVAKKKFGGRDIIYGKEALENRLALDLYRPMAGSSVKHKGAQDDPKRKKAIKDLLEHVVSLAKIPKGATIYGMIGAPAEASVEGKATILEAAKDCIDSVIICSEPYAVAYGLDFIDNTLVIDIGAGTTDLCRLHGTMPKPEDQRTHEIAGDAIDQELARLIKEKYPQAQFSINMVRHFKEKYSSVSPNMDRAIVEMPVAGKPQKFDITELVYKACYTIVPPTVAALQELISTYDPEFQAQMRNNILLGGGGSQIKGLGLAIERALEEYGGGKVTTVEEPQYAGANGALKFALDMPLEFWKEFQSGRSHH
ncbi:MAG: rod shape-determining protein [Planctomycetota bacterium]|nr:rod shape-determining protein [Planctomycetota bacterium]MCX8040298.1 rod shape-determining protein [Planctomycetota bacterium]MDW8372407.1 rod shape-determining protein [Planctomycetota bacterium]